MSALMMQWGMMEDPLLDKYADVSESGQASIFRDVDVLMRKFEQLDGAGCLTAYNKTILILVEARNRVLDDINDPNERKAAKLNMKIQEGLDPVHCDHFDEKWYFWIETWHDRYGPYDSEDIARVELDLYLKFLETGAYPEDRRIKENNDGTG